MKTIEYNSNDSSIVVCYALPDLPTAQHKAGLAGLYAYLQKMAHFCTEKPVPEIKKESDWELHVRFTEETLASLMDSVYAGEEVENWQKKKRKDKDNKDVPPIKEEEHTEEHKDGTLKKVTCYCYKDIQPRADFVRYLRGSSNDPWVGLWREAIRKVLRDSRSGEIYNHTPSGKSPTENAGDLKNIWKDLHKAAQNGKPVTRDAPTSVFIGAEGKNAERVRFKGEVHHNLLLHFWPFVSPIFVPRTVEFQKKEKAKQIDHGFAIVVPEITNLQKFNCLISKYWRSQPNKEIRKNRPDGCFIDVMIEGGLMFLYSLVQDEIDEIRDIDAVSNVEIYHLKKHGNNIEMLSAETLYPDMRMLREYKRICHNNRKPNFLFKKMCLRNLIANQSWYKNASEMLFSKIPAEFFICSRKTPSFCRDFGLSVQQHFQEIKSDQEKSYE